MNIKDKVSSLFVIGVLGTIVFVTLCLLVLLQGGYYPSVTGLAGFFFSITGIIVLIRRRKSLRTLPKTTLLMFLVALCFFVGAVLNTACLTSIAETGTWFAAAAFSLLVAFMSKAQRDKVITLLVLFGYVCVLLAFLVKAGLINIPGAIPFGRLYFTFQYANTAALWFGFLFLMAFFEKNALIQRFAPLFIVPMLLTISGGASMCFAVVSIIILIHYYRKDDNQMVLNYMFDCLLGIVIFVPMYFASEGLLGIFWFAVACICCQLKGKANEFIVRKSHPEKLVKTAAIVVVALCVGMAVLLNDQIARAIANFAERLVYDGDAITILLTSPLFGIGPDMWQFVYPYYQSAQYSVSVVHCSYLQIALDSGLVGIGLFAAALYFGMRDTFKSNKIIFLGALLIVLHAFVDFDLQYGSILFLLLLLVTPVSEAERNETTQTPLEAKVRRSPATYGAIVVICLFGTFMGWGSAGNLANLQVADEMGAYEQAVKIFTDNPLAKSDPKAQEYLLECSLNTGNIDNIVSFCNSRPVRTSRQAILCYKGLYESGDTDTATNIIIDLLERQPFNYNFYVYAGSAFDEVGVTDECIELYNQAVDAANQRVASSTPLMAGVSKYLPYYSRS